MTNADTNTSLGYKDLLQKLKIYQIKKKKKLKTLVTRITSIGLYC